MPSKCVQLSTLLSSESPRLPCSRPAPAHRKSGRVRKPSPFTGRKVVVVFTDGDDTASKVGMGDALERARIEDVMVYAIGLQSEYFNGQQRVRSRPDRGLKKLAEETGGGYFELKKTDELGPTFTRVAQELHSQYVLGFSPQALDGKVHKVETKVKKPGMTARARKSYVAAPAGTQTEK
ncbi:MAG: VWA domain-containing protein [Acidobacteria bacterium]|nr:VWA domain-containing protein [Acidobacteriota bacterium]